MCSGRRTVVLHNISDDPVAVKVPAAPRGADRLLRESKQPRGEQQPSLYSPFFSSQNIVAPGLESRL